MREIISYKKQKQAETLSNYLTTLYIDNKVVEEDNLFEVWVFDENKLIEAQQAVKDFKRSPKEMKFEFAHIKAKEIYDAKVKQEKIEKKKRPRIIDGRQSFTQSGNNIGKVTSILIVISVLLTAIFFFTKNIAVANWIVFFPPAIESGQLWRLFTPIFLHGSPDSFFNTFIHLFFNMFWLRDFGTAIELIQGKKFFIILIVVISFVSNFFQYQVSGPNFWGMSGVVYGLFGYIWMKAQFDDGSGYMMNQMTVVLLLFFLVLGFLGMSGIANFAHLGGLLAGMVWGYTTSSHFRRIFK